MNGDEPVQMNQLERDAYTDMVLEFFAHIKIFTSRTRLVDFANSDAVMRLSREFFDKLSKEWRLKHPNAPKPERKFCSRKQLRKNQPMTSPDLDTEKPPETAIQQSQPSPTETSNTALPGPQNNPHLKPGQTPPANTPSAKAPEAKFFFHLPNGKMGQPYHGEIISEPKLEFGVSEVKFPPEWADFAFDKKTQTVTGTPHSAGDFKFPVLYRTVLHEQHSGECAFVVIPDPNSLWQDIPQDTRQMYGDKPPEDKKIETGNHFRIVAASRRGRSHAHVGSYRDDDFFVQKLETGWSVLLVADGAGSAKYSREGSRLAAQTAGMLLSNALSTPEAAQEPEAFLADWEHQQNAFHAWFHNRFFEAAKAAVQEIEKEAGRQHAAPKDYATTLLAAAVKRSGERCFLATLWIGDGAIAAYSAKTPDIVKLMGEPDSGEYAGQTRFLDQAILKDGFSKRIRVGCWPGISHVLLMTDGVSDPYFETDNGLKNAEKWTKLIEDVSPLLKAEDAEQKLLEWMAFPSPGHHDDRTLVIAQFFGELV